MVTDINKSPVLKKFFFLYLSLAGLLTGQLYAQTGIVKFNRVTIKNERPNLQVSAILRHSKELMWFGTENGLFQFDGHKYQEFKSNYADKTTISENRVFDICEDKDGSLWIGTFAGLSKYNRASSTFSRFNITDDHKNFLDNFILQVKLDEKGRLFVKRVFSGLYLLHPETKKFEQLLIYKNDPADLPDNNIIDSYIDKPGVIWFCVNTFWLTWWFKLLASPSIAGSAVVFRELRTNIIETQKKRLQQQVHKQTRQLSQSTNEEQRSRQQAEHTNIELERKNTELEQFAYVAPHDLQEPLRTTPGFVKLIRQQYHGKLDERAHKYFSYIPEASDRMKLLIKNPLDYPRIGSKKELEQGDCNKTLQDMVANPGAAINDAKADIQYNPLPVNSGYITEIKRLFQNLIINAVKFRKKSVVPQMEISVKKIKDKCGFSFKDDGIGTEKSTVEKYLTYFNAYIPVLNLRVPELDYRIAKNCGAASWGNPGGINTRAGKYILFYYSLT